MEERLVVDPSTGEITTTLRDGDTILRGNSKDKLASTMKLNEGRTYIKVYTESLCRMLEEDNLSGSDISLVFSMLPFVQFETGLVVHANGRHVTMQKLAKISKLSERTAYRSIESLVQKKIIAKVRTGHDIKFYVNPYIFMKGVVVNKTLESMFRASKYTEG